jgi:hypothetical protein
MPVEEAKGLGEAQNDPSVRTDGFGFACYFGLCGGTGVVKGGAISNSIVTSSYFVQFGS